MIWGYPYFWKHPYKGYVNQWSRGTVHNSETFLGAPFRFDCNLNLVCAYRDEQSFSQPGWPFSLLNDEQVRQGGSWAPTSSLLLVCFFFVFWIHRVFWKCEYEEIRLDDDWIWMCFEWCVIRCGDFWWLQLSSSWLCCCYVLLSLSV